jgi:hypothetical protein
MGRRILLGVAGVAGLAALARQARAGDLSPPAGPISPTGVRLTDINTKLSSTTAALDAVSHKVGPFPQTVAEPRCPLSACAAPPGSDCLYRITQPGAYCMTENVQQVAGVACCVSIECDGVDLDGQGFSFVGSGDPTMPPSACIRASGRVDLEIYDCAFRGWSGECCACATCDDCYISDILVLRCSAPFNAATGALGDLLSFRDRCEVSEVCVSQCDFSRPLRLGTRDTCNGFTVIDCTGPALECGDNCCLEDISVINCAMAAGGGGGGGAGGMITCGSSCSVSSVNSRTCTCPAGFFVAGDKWVCEDACLTSIAGDCVRCGDGCCVRDMQISSCTGHGIQARTGACIEDVSFHNHQGDCVTVLDNGAVCDVECRSCTGVAITCGVGACVEEVAISSHTGDCVRCAAGSCVTEVECRSCVGVCISVGQSSLIEDCDVSGGGGGGSYRCADGSCVRRSRSHSRDASVDIAVTDRCSVEDCKVVRGQGITCGSSCCITGNELSSCVGAPDSTAGTGGAVVVTGSHTCVDDNLLTDCRVAISVQSSGHFCSVDDNHISASVGGISGGVIAGIVISPAASRVMCTCNHLRVPPGADAFLPGSSSFGPLVFVQAAGGDISATPSSSHHLANYIVS